MVKVRDAALKIKDELPKSDVNREYYLQVCKTNHQQCTVHGYCNSLTISNNSWIMKETFFLMATFRMSTVPLQSRRPLDQAVLWANCLGGDIFEYHWHLGKLPGWGYF